VKQKHSHLLKSPVDESIAKLASILKECTSKGLKLVRLTTIIESIGWNRWKDNGLRQTIYKYDVIAHYHIHVLLKLFLASWTGSKLIYGKGVGISRKCFTWED